MQVINRQTGTRKKTGTDKIKLQTARTVTQEAHLKDWQRNNGSGPVHCVYE